MNPEDQRERTDKIVEKYATENLQRIFETNDPTTWQATLIERLQRYDYITEADIARAEEILAGIEGVEEIDVFLEKAKNALKPLIDHVKEDPEGYQSEQQEHALSDEKKERVNELLSYHLDDSGGMHLHVIPNMFTSNSEKLRLLREGLREAAQIANNEDGINTIYATSWIVAKNPELLKKLGFSINGEITEDDYDNLFQGENREVWSASISREDFITKYL